MRLIGRAFPIFALLIAPIVSHAQEITTYAGGGGTYLTNGILATNALLFGAPQGVAMDQAGNLYYFDVQGYVVRQVNTAGVVNTVAGNGSFAAPILGSIGDGGPATSAGFGTTGVFASIAVDGPGNLYIADPGNNRVRKVDTHGIITTFAGSGGPGNTGDGGPANRAGFGQITGVAVDASGNVYIADFTFGRIRKVDTSGNISTFAGGGTGGDGGQAATASIAGPYGLAADKQGNIYIAEAGNTGTQRVRKVTPGGVISTVAGGNGVGYTGDGGQAINAKFFSIQGIVVDNAGNLYIADHGNEVVRKVDASGIVTTVAGNGRNTTGGDGGFATAAGLNPTGLAVDGSGNLYIGDQAGRVRKVAFGTPPPGLYATALNLSFYATTRNAATANQLLVVTIATLGAPIMPSSVSSAVQSGGNWMNMGTTSGTTPTVIQVSAAGNPGAGVYHRDYHGNAHDTRIFAHHDPSHVHDHRICASDASHHRRSKWRQLSIRLPGQFGLDGEGNQPGFHHRYLEQLDRRRRASHFARWRDRDLRRHPRLHQLHQFHPDQPGYAGCVLSRKRGRQQQWQLQRRFQCVRIGAGCARLLPVAQQSGGGHAHGLYLRCGAGNFFGPHHDGRETW